MRSLSGIDDDEYLSSIGPKKLLTGLLSGEISSLSELCSPGKSGSFLYYTHDGKKFQKKNF